MRHQLIEALTFPKLLVQELIEEGNFPHQNLYAATGERCNHCDLTGDCTWQHCLQDFREVNNVPTEMLSASLREGIKLVESLHSELRHDETTCTCETCIWIRNAERLTEECEHHLPHVEPAMGTQEQQSD